MAGVCAARRSIRRFTPAPAWAPVEQEVEAPPQGQANLGIAARAVHCLLRPVVRSAPRCYAARATLSGAGPQWRLTKSINPLRRYQVSRVGRRRRLRTSRTTR
jgi:hypothetical protein